MNNLMFYQKLFYIFAIVFGGGLSLTYILRRVIARRFFYKTFSYANSPSKIGLSFIDVYSQLAETKNKIFHNIMTYLALANMACTLMYMVSLMIVY